MIQGESLVVDIVYNYNYINTGSLGYHSSDKRSLACSELNMFGLEFMIPNSSCLIHMQCISILIRTRERERKRERGGRRLEKILPGKCYIFSTFYHWISPTMNSTAKELWKICSNKIWKHKKAKKKKFKVHNLFGISPQTLFLSLCPHIAFYICDIFVILESLALCLRRTKTFYVLSLLFFIFFFLSFIFLLWIKDNRVKHFICTVACI